MDHRECSRSSDGDTGSYSRFDCDFGPVRYHDKLFRNDSGNSEYLDRHKFYGSGRSDSCG